MSPPPVKDHRDHEGRLEFLVWSKNEEKTLQVLAVGVATDDDLAGIAREEQDASLAECVVVATLEHNRTGRRRINYLWKLGDTYTRASYESVTRWYCGLWEEQIVTGGTSIQTGRSTRILNILDGHETLDQAMKSNLDPHVVQSRQAAARDSTIQALKQEATYLEAIQDPKKKADETPKQSLQPQVKHKIEMHAVPATEDQDHETSGDDTRAPRPKRSVGAPKRFKEDDSYGSEEDSSCEQRQMRPRKIVKLPVKKSRTSISPGRRSSLAAAIPNTSQMSVGAITSSPRWPKRMTEEAKTALLDAVRSTPQIKAEREAIAVTAPSDLAYNTETQGRTSASVSIPPSSALTQTSTQVSTAGSSITAATTPIISQESKQTNDMARKEALKLLTEASSGRCDPEEVQLAVQTLTGQKPPHSIIQRATFARVVTRSVESIYDFAAYRQWFRDNEVSMMADDSGAEAI